MAVYADRVEGIAGGVPQPISGTVDTELPAAAALSDAMVTAPTVPAVGAYGIVVSPLSGFAERSRAYSQDGQALIGLPAVGIVAANLAGTADRIRGDGTNGLKVFQRRVQGVGQTSAANATQTLTLAAPGVGLVYHIWAVRIVRVATAAVVGGAVLTYTTTQLNGIGWITGNAIAAGQVLVDVDLEMGAPIQSDTPNTAVTIIAPAAGAATVTRIEVWSSIGPQQP